MARRAARDVAARLAGVAIGARAGAGPARRMKRARRIERAELGVAARAEPRALVAADAERLRAVTRCAVRLAAPRVDRVGEEVVAGVEVHRLDHTLVARHALA